MRLRPAVGEVAEHLGSTGCFRARRPSLLRGRRGLAYLSAARSLPGELFWASAMAENGILKIGKATAFQAHMIERQLGAYTDCNHGFGLAVIHPTMYRHMMAGAPEKFARFATEVWGIDAAGKSAEELAAAGIDALEAFIAEIGLPSTLSEMGISGEGTDDILRAVADSTIIIPTCPKVLDAEEVFEILEAVK